MNLEYLKLFNDSIDKNNFEQALFCLEETFNKSDSKYIKVKNLFLYLLACIKILPEEYLDYVKTIYSYDLVLPVMDASISEAKSFVRAIMFNDFVKARNIYYENMDIVNYPEFSKVLLNLLSRAHETKKVHEQTIAKLLNEKSYYNLYVYVSNLVNTHPTFNNIFTLYLLLKDYLNKDYYIKGDESKDLSIVELIKNKRYFEVWEYFDKLYKREKDNVEIEAIVTILNQIMREKKVLPLDNFEEEKTEIDKEMYLDFLDVVKDEVEKEGFVILNPENAEINRQMLNLTYYDSNLGAYEIGRENRQIVINSRRRKASYDIKKYHDTKHLTYKEGDYLGYITNALEYLKHFVPSEADIAKLSQSYLRMGKISEGIKALKLAIGLKEYNNNYNPGINMLYYYMTLDYFNNKNIVKNKVK